MYNYWKCRCYELLILYIRSPWTLILPRWCGGLWTMPSAMWGRQVFSKATKIHMIITGSFTAFIHPHDFKCYRFVLWCLWNCKMIFMCPVFYMGVVEWTMLLCRFPWVMINHWVSNNMMNKNKSVSYLAGKIRFSGTQIIICKSYHHMETSLGIIIVISWLLMWNIITFWNKVYHFGCQLCG